MGCLVSEKQQGNIARTCVYLLKLYNGQSASSSKIVEKWEKKRNFYGGGDWGAGPRPDAALPADQMLLTTASRCYSAISSLLSIRAKIPGMDRRSTCWVDRMGMLSRSSSPT